MVMQQQLTLESFQTLTFLSEDFLAKLSALLENEQDLKILEELFSLKSQGFSPLKNLSYVSLKTSKAYSHTIQGEPLDILTKPYREWVEYGSKFRSFVKEFDKQDPDKYKYCPRQDAVDKGYKMYSALRGLCSKFGTKQEMPTEEQLDEVLKPYTYPQHRPEVIRAVLALIERKGK